MGLGDASSAFSGSIIGTGNGGNGPPNAGLTSLLKTGSGMFMLAGGGFTYSGSTLVNSGTLTLSNVGNNFASSPVVAPAATVVLSASSFSESNVFAYTLTHSNAAFTGSGTIVKTDTGWTEFGYNAIIGFSGQINI